METYMYFVYAIGALLALLIGSIVILALYFIVRYIILFILYILITIPFALLEFLINDITGKKFEFLTEPFDRFEKWAFPPTKREPKVKSPWKKYQEAQIQQADSELTKFKEEIEASKKDTTYNEIYQAKKADMDARHEVNLKIKLKEAIENCEDDF